VLHGAWSVRQLSSDRARSARRRRASLGFCRRVVTAICERWRSNRRASASSSRCVWRRQPLRIACRNCSGEVVSLSRYHRIRSLHAFSVRTVGTFAPVDCRLAGPGPACREQSMNPGPGGPFGPVAKLASSRSRRTGALTLSGIATAPRPPAGLNPHRPRPSIRGLVQSGFCAIPHSCTAVDYALTRDRAEPSIIFSGLVSPGVPR
jgi:hypothetical protein